MDLTQEQDRGLMLDELGSPPLQRIGPWLWPIALGTAIIAGTLLILVRSQVSLGACVVFFGYVLVGVTLPGTLVWRSVRRREAPLVEDLAAGTAVGYSLEVLAYIATRWVGAPRLFLILPAGILICFATVPRMRPYWRIRVATTGTPACRHAVWAAMAAIPIVWSWLAFFRATRIDRSGYRIMDYDMPYHLALTGDIKHHMPPMVSWVSGERLYYHWFVYADMAATSWATGIELHTLLYRLSPLPMLIAFVMLVSAVARRLVGAWWAGPAAVIATVFGLAPNPYGWRLGDFFVFYGFSAVEDGSLLRPTMWNSPTQTFAGLLCAALVLMVIDRLREDAAYGSRREWALGLIVMVALMGAKATYLPILLGGITASLVAFAIRTKRLHRPALIVAGGILACLTLAQLVLFGGVNHSLTVSPFAISKSLGIAMSTEFLSFNITPPVWRTTLVVALCVLGWMFTWAGVLGLVKRRRILATETAFMLGVGAAGMVAVFAFKHPGLSQVFFFESARPYLAILAVSGVAALAGPSGGGRRLGVTLGCAAVAGALLVYLVRALDGPVVPILTSTFGPKRVAFALLWPYAALVVALALAGLGLVLARPRLGWPVGVVGAALVVATMGCGIPTAVDQIRHQALTNPNGWRRATMKNRPATTGTLEAGRWLRDHSHPDDLIATNDHCRSREAAICDLHHFSVAAFTERRVLVESWGYTSTEAALSARPHAIAGATPFWNQPMLAANESAFFDPSPTTVGWLRDRYGVRWLFADESQRPPSPALGRYATLRFRSGDCAVYQLGNG